MRTMRRWLSSMAIAATTAGAVLVGPPAMATEPVGGCAPPFGDPIAIEDVDPRAHAVAVFVDTVAPGNNDGYVCFRLIATTNQSGWLELGVIIDNRVQ